MKEDVKEFFRQLARELAAGDGTLLSILITSSFLIITLSLLAVSMI